jgi:hypothetical protein
MTCEDVMRDSAQSEIRKLELETARIANRRQRHEAQGLDLAEAERHHQATLENFVLEGIRAAGLTRLPLSVILEKIKALGVGPAVQEVGSDPGNPRSVKPFDEEVDRNRQVVFVKITRNLSVDNRRAIEEHGLRWNGKRGGWKGMAGAAAIEGLREKFGDRLTILSEKQPPSEDGSDWEGAAPDPPPCPDCPSVGEAAEGSVPTQETPATSTIAPSSGREIEAASMAAAADSNSGGLQSPYSWPKPGALPRPAIGGRPQADG